MCDLSVIICTHNPKTEYLARVLESLEAQNVFRKNWELILVDNKSDEPVAERFDLSWHPRGRVVVQEELGLTPARLKGIAESVGEVLVFVDDDNILSPRFLHHTLVIARDWPDLGAWGGQIFPEFEIEPEPWAKPYLCNLALREFERDRWSNMPGAVETFPCGAGMCVRRRVAELYASKVQGDPIRRLLGRTGNNMTSCEDTDLAWCANDEGLGTGMFSRLEMTHIIPAKRISLEYMLKLVEGIEYSWTILEAMRRGYYPPGKVSFIDRLRREKHLRSLDDITRQFEECKLRGRARAHEFLARFKDAPRSDSGAILVGHKDATAALSA